MTVRRATPAEVAACHGATFRPCPAAAMVPGPAGDVPRVVLPAVGGDLLADIEGLPLGCGRVAWAGGLYRVGTWDHWTHTRHEQVQAIIAVDDSHSPSPRRRLSWLVAVLHTDAVAPVGAGG